jgi:hypothetical protein
LLSWFLGEQPLGIVTLRARDFPVVREVTTSSWLGLPHHGKGYGTEARAGLLMLAFDHLGTDAALTEVFQDDHSSQDISRKLGYEPDGISRDACGSEVVTSDRLRLTRQKWRSQPRTGAAVSGSPIAAPCSGSDNSPICRDDDRVLSHAERADLHQVGHAGSAVPRAH